MLTIDLNRANDAWSNLRDATRSQNEANKRGRNKLGKGITATQSGKYEVRIQANGRRINLGTTDNLTIAGYLYAIGADGYHREFARL